MTNPQENPMPSKPETVTFSRALLKRLNNHRGNAHRVVVYSDGSGRIETVDGVEVPGSGFSDCDQLRTPDDAIRELLKPSPLDDANTVSDALPEDVGSEVQAAMGRLQGLAAGKVYPRKDESS